ncbi:MULTISPECIES: hypothetical protein [Actinomyces]|uniref:Uncharacterized protein n=1 Tax=Actinomyces respiraculi TaxID=2744574 RepID=A0A7T0LJP2_9ACTO|nr:MULTISPECIES: hypothetical protein [Actinomyces]QPL05014.1 hypothetical protein ID810_09735 [Actinomyces respiraculi]
MERTSLSRAVAQARRGESGAATAVYAGVIVVVVILVGVLAVGMTPVGRDIAAGVHNEICRIFDMSCDSGEQTGQDGQDVGSQSVDPRRPGECVVSSHEDGSSTYVKIGFVKIGSSFGFVTQQEQYYDPETGQIKTRYKVIATDGAALGAETGIGTKGEVGNSGIGADLSLEAGFDVKGGDTWSFDSEAEMNAFIDQYNKYRLQRQMLSGEGAFGSAIYLSMTNGFVDRPRTSDKRSTTLKMEDKGNFDVGLRVGKDNAETGEKSVNLKAGLYAQASLSDVYTHTEDLRPDHKGEFSETVTYSGSIGGGVNAVFAGVGGNGSYKGATTYNYKPGPDGKPVLSSITFSQVTSGDLTWKGGNGPVNSAGGVTGNIEGGTSDRRSHVTETTIEVTDANRAVIAQWQRDSLVTDPTTGATRMLLLPNVLDPSVPYPNNPMAQLLYEKASNTHTTYNVSGDNFSLRGEVALGLKIGGGFSITNEDQNVADSTYLKSPSSPGAPRQRVDNLVCQ